MKILIVEDDQLVAASLQMLLEGYSGLEVTQIVGDLPEATRAVEINRPDWAVVDIELSHGSTGFAVAAMLRDRAIPCIFSTGFVPALPMPELAIGCLAKPFRDEAITQAIGAVEAFMNEPAATRHAPSPDVEIDQGGWGYKQGWIPYVREITHPTIQ